MHDATINIRVRRFDLDLIDRAAEIEGKTRSAFLRDCAEAYARLTLAKRGPVIVARDGEDARK